ncbi:hypothetical protein [Oceanobacillus sp. FSL H7-0719]|uniref:hypothetical protein n=1 Tax=Oceanobacillus sp. FSL H7-0719 TaxID=2954507 RepID=UPI003251CC38
MISDNRYPIANTASSNKDNISNSNIATFQYNPPNNTGTTLGILGGVLTTVGDALATIGAIIQLNTDNTADFESQVGSFKSDQEMEKMQAEIDNLQEKLKQLEQLIKSDQS